MFFLLEAWRENAVGIHFAPMNQEESFSRPGRAIACRMWPPLRSDLHHSGFCRRFEDGNGLDGHVVLGRIGVRADLQRALDQ